MYVDSLPATPTPPAACWTPTDPWISSPSTADPVRAQDQGKTRQPQMERSIRNCVNRDRTMKTSSATLSPVQVNNKSLGK